MNERSYALCNNITDRYSLLKILILLYFGILPPIPANLYYNKYDVPIIFSKKDKTNKYTTIYMCMLLYNIIYMY